MHEWCLQRFIQLVNTASRNWSHRFQAVCWQHGSNSRRTCPIHYRSLPSGCGHAPRTALTAAHLPQPSGAHRRSTRIELPRRTRSEGARQLIFLCSALVAHIARPIPHRPSQFSRPAFFCRSFSGHCFRLIPASCSFAASAFPVPALHHWVPSHGAEGVVSAQVCLDKNRMICHSIVEEGPNDQS